MDAMLEQPTGGASLRTPMGYEEYLALGETKHHEYYDGLCVVNPPSRSHSRTQAHLVDLIRPHCPDSHEVLTGWGWHIGPELDYEPDIMVTDRSSPDDDVLRHPPPLLVVEISSPSTRDVDFGKKRRSLRRRRRGLVLDRRPPAPGNRRLREHRRRLRRGSTHHHASRRRRALPCPYRPRRVPGRSVSRPGRSLRRSHSPWGSAPPWVILRDV